MLIRLPVVAALITARGCEDLSLPTSLLPSPEGVLGKMVLPKGSISSRLRPADGNGGAALCTAASSLRAPPLQPPPLIPAMPRSEDETEGIPTTPPALLPAGPAFRPEGGGKFPPTGETAAVAAARSVELTSARRTSDGSAATTSASLSTKEPPKCGAAGVRLRGASRSSKPLRRPSLRTGATGLANQELPPYGGERRGGGC